MSRTQLYYFTVEILMLDTQTLDTASVLQSFAFVQDYFTSSIGFLDLLIRISFADSFGCL